MPNGVGAGNQEDLGLVFAATDNLNYRVGRVEETLLPLVRDTVSLKERVEKFKESQSNWIATIVGVGGLILGVTATLIGATLFLFGGISDVKETIANNERSIASLEDSAVKTNQILEKMLVQDAQRDELAKENFENLEILVTGHEHRLDFPEK